MQFEYLEEMAENGESFIVVGRCSEHVLKENPNMISIFILGDIETKALRIAKIHNITVEKAKELLIKTDKKRKYYHNHYCKGKWGDSRNYEVSINSSKIGVDETVKILTEYINIRKR